MRTHLKITGAVLAAALAAGLGAAPAAAKQGRGPDGQRCTTCGQSQERMQQLGKKQKARAVNSKPNGTLTKAQKRELKAMAEEEKLAHDVYVALSAQYPSAVQFSNISRAESRHLQAVRKMLDRYGLSDPTAGRAAGEFATAATQDLYESLLAQATTEQAAYDVGITIEKMDIADLKDAMSGLKAKDVKFVYSRLLQGSQKHLQAFGG
jgi:hypothetical protein